MEAAEPICSSACCAAAPADGACNRSSATAIRHIAAATATPAPTSLPCARPETPYLREDVILGQIISQVHTISSRDAGVRDEIATLQQTRNVTDLITFLRVHSIVIECHATGISLEPDHHKSIIVRSAANGLEREVRIPRQRSHQQIQQRGIAER